VPLLKSLFCWFGSDSRSRFFIIIITTQILFLFFSLLFAKSAVFISSVLVILTWILICSTKRRSNEVNIEKYWCLAPNLAFFLTGFLIIIVENNHIYWLSLISSTVFLLLLRHNDETERGYILGYRGPVDLCLYQQNNQKSKRIEPTFTNSSAATISNTVQMDMKSNQSTQQMQQSISLSQQNSNNIDLNALIITTFKKNKRMVLILSTVAIIMLFGIILNNSISSPSLPEGTQILSSESPGDDQSNFSNFITLPDDFSLMTTDYEGIIISWSADHSDESVIWDIDKAQGDKSCQSISFNNKVEFRSLLVSIKDKSTYLAKFSPLDTEKIIKNMALRSSFKLCDYEFSLKGSQAALGKNTYYADKVTY